MINIKNTLLRFKVSARNKITNIKNGVQKFKENISETKNQPRSKRRSLLLGFTTAITIFGITLIASVLPAIAKNVPKNTPKLDPGPGQVCPCPALKPALIPSEQIVSVLAGATATICSLAIYSGFFMIDTICDVIVVIGILKASGK